MKKVFIKKEKGIHARPASELVEISKGFASKINLIKDGDAYNAKSVMSVLAMNISNGDTIYIDAEGTDSNEAENKIFNFLNV